MTLAAEFTVRPSLLDGNGHVDNAWYITFVTDSLPEEYRKLTPRDFRINYSKELFLGDKVLVNLGISEDKKKITFIGERLLADGQKEISFESELYF